MSSDEQQPSLDDLKARVEKARQAHRPQTTPDSGSRGNAISVAFRLGIELVAGLVVGGGLGWFLDDWLGTQPVFLLIFFVLGAVAGILNVVRQAKQMNPPAADDGAIE